MTVFAAAGALMLSGCAASEPTAVPTVETVVEPEVSASAAEEVVVAPSEEPSPEPAPVIAPIGTEVVNLTHKDGYVGTATIDWLPISTIDASQVPESCLGWILANRPGLDVGNSVFSIAPASVRFDFPTVDGFVWPSDSVTTWGFDEGASCAPAFPNLSGTSDGIIVPSVTGVVDMYAIFAEEKTPNNPNGDPKTSPARVSLKVGPQYVKCEGVLSCMFSYPQ